MFFHYWFFNFPETPLRKPGLVLLRWSESWYLDKFPRQHLGERDAGGLGCRCSSTSRLRSLFSKHLKGRLGVYVRYIPLLFIQIAFHLQTERPFCSRLNRGIFSKHKVFGLGAIGIQVYTECGCSCGRRNPAFCPARPQCELCSWIY